MPCNCDYMEPTARERELGKIKSLLDELDRKEFNHAKSDMHPEVYNQGITTVTADVWISELCQRCRRIDHIGELTKFSLELQMWWRDHQIKDAKHLAEAEEMVHELEIKQRALGKLTDREREILGI